MVIIAPWTEIAAALITVVAPAWIESFEAPFVLIHGSFVGRGYRIPSANHAGLCVAVSFYCKVRTTELVRAVEVCDFSRKSS